MVSFSPYPLDSEIDAMTTAYGCFTHLRPEDLRRFMVSLLVLLAIGALLLVPDLAHAADAGGGASGAGGWNGQFGPDSNLTKNTNSSLQGWWRAIAGWGLYLSLAALLFSIFFAGGKLWYVPVIVFLICLFGEKTIGQVATWAGFANFTT